MTSFAIASLHRSTLSSHPDALLLSEGLARDPRQLPAFSMWEFLEVIMTNSRVDRNAMRRKMTALLAFLAADEESGPLKRRLCADQAHTTRNLHNDALFFDATVLHLFAYAYGLRFEFFYATGNKLCVQYFGMRDKPTRRVYVAEDSYVILKRVFTNKTKKTVVSAPASPRCDLDRETSTHTAATSASCERDGEPTAASRHAQPTFISDAPAHPFTLSSAATNGRPAPGKALGRLKFFNEAKEYGFIVADDGSEIFVHKADLQKQSIDTRYLAYFKKYYEVVMEFAVQEYQGKSKKHRKAVDVLIFDMQPLS